MSEAQMQSKFTRWARSCWQGGSAGFELKVSKNDRIPFSHLAEHQVKALLDCGQIKNTTNKNTTPSCLVYKISDSAIGYKPFDCFVLQGSGAFFVFGFYGGKECWMVDVKRVVGILYDAGEGRRRGSVTAQWARDNGSKVW